MENNLDLSIIILELGINAIEAQSKVFKIKIVNAKDIYFEVTDDGISIKEEDINKIFLPSFSLKQNHLGMGLYKIKNYCEANNGFINVDIKNNVTFKGQLNCEIGNLRDTIITLILNDSNCDIELSYQNKNKVFNFSTLEIKNKYNIKSLTEPSIIKNIMMLIDNGINSIKD